MNKVVVCAVIKNQENKILAAHLNKEKPEGIWVMPGGKLEDGESARACVTRECKEELGIDIEPRKITAIGEVEYDEDNIWIFVYYESTILSGESAPQEENKTIGVGYVDLKDIHMCDKITWIQ